jgi:nucleoid DNA-binding protein
MTVAEALIEALYTYDKVALPGLGYFVCTYAPAYIHPTQHLFQPPNKQVGFELSADYSDDIVVGYLVSYNQLTKNDAQEQVQAFIQQIKDSLADSGKMSLTGLGEWYYDIEKVLKFRMDESMNFMKEAYGLPPFVGEMVSRRPAAAPTPVAKPNAEPKPTPVQTKIVEPNAVAESPVVVAADKKPAATLNINTLAYALLGIVVAAIIILLLLQVLHIIKI